MKTDFRRAPLPGDLRSLQSFDRKIFSKSDRFPAAYWKLCESWWMVIDGRKVGCCAFETDSQCEGTLYIATTGILPGYRRRGLGALLKAWEVAYARHQGYTRIVTHSRQSNAAIIHLNKSFGFRIVRTIAKYYEDPVESSLEMELKF